ncbi:MAG: SGNH/GDSL hydrolase family protein [Patescibacteria group bacterium]|nr:SGNH/GDSL hydrolase family protein [Patescibacteria group bacterium]
MSRLTLIGFLVVTLILAEVISLLQLRSSLTSNATYWHNLQSQPGELTYIALGDSAAQGIGASRPNNGYVGLVAARLATKTGKTIRVVNLSVSGAKIQDVIQQQIPQLAGYKPDFVTIEIGANDLVSFNATDFKNSYRQLAPLLPRGTVVANMPNFGGRIKRVMAVQAANKIVADTAAAHNLPMADLHTATKSRESPFNYAADFFHPSNRGYRNWADAFWIELNKL